MPKGGTYDPLEKPHLKKKKKTLILNQIYILILHCFSKINRFFLLYPLGPIFMAPPVFITRNYESRKTNAMANSHAKIIIYHNKKL